MSKSLFNLRSIKGEALNLKTLKRHIKKELVRIGECL